MPTDNKNNLTNPAANNNNEKRIPDPNFSIKRGSSDFRTDANDASIQQIERLTGNKGGNQNNNDNK